MSEFSRGEILRINCMGCKEVTAHRILEMPESRDGRAMLKCPGVLSTPRRPSHPHDRYLTLEEMRTALSKSNRRR